MKQIVIQGGKPLRGSTEIPGAKNSALPLMAAAVLCSGSVELSRVPFLSDIEISMQILRSLGCTALRKANGHVLIHAPRLTNSAVPQHLMCAMRSSIFFLAPLLVRTGCAEISMPGGCKLGARPIDIHLDGLAAMSVAMEEHDDALVLRAPNGLQAAEFALRFPSVGATETLLMAAAGAHGVTVLHNVAKEPEIEDLIRFLQQAGVPISGIGTSRLVITGQEMLQGVNFTVCPDRIVSATVLCGVAACGGEALLTGCCAEHMQAVLPLLHTLGATVLSPGNADLYIVSAGPQDGLGHKATGVYPALPTDAAPLLAAAALRTKGQTVLRDTVFENRFSCADGFAALGAQVRCSGRALSIIGTQMLQGAALYGQDLRGTAALVLAALQAQGESTLQGVSHLDRGYEDIVALFAGLGAEITYKINAEEGLCS